MFQAIFNHGIFRAYSTSLLGVASGLLTSLWLLSEITKVIPANDFGIYAFVLQLSGYLAILQLGLDFAASRQIAESLGRNDFKEASRAFSDLLRFNYKIVLVAVLGVLALSTLLWSGLLFKQSIDVSATKLAAMVALTAGASQVITFLSRPFSAALLGSQFQATVNIFTVVRTLGTTLMAFVFLKSGFYIFAVPAAEVVMQLVSFFILRSIVNRKCLWVSVPPGSEEDKQVLGSMLRYGGLASLGGLAWTIEAGMDVVILGMYANAGVVAAYVLWWRFPQMIFDICSRLAFSAFPRFSNSFGVSREAARAIFTKISYGTLGLATLSLVGISYWLRPFMHLWIGEDYLGEQSIHLPVMMGLLVCLRAGGNLLGMFWLASGRAEFTTALAWVQAALKLALALWLVPKWGVTGVVVASCGASLVQVAAMAGLLLRERLLDFAMGGRALAFTALATLVALMSLRWPMDIGWFGLIVGVAATCAIWSGCWVMLACTGDFRKPMAGAFLQMARRARLLRVV